MKKQWKRKTVLLYGMHFMKLHSYEWTEEKRLFPLIGSGAFPPFSNSPPPDESKVGETDFFFSPHFFHSLLPAGKKLSLPSFAILNFPLQSREKGKTGRKGKRKVFPSPPFSILAILRSQERKTEKIEKQFSAFSFGVFYVHLFFLSADWVLRQDTAIDGDSLSYLDMMERSTAEEARRERERVIMEEGK